MHTPIPALSNGEVRFQKEFEFLHLFNELRSLNQAASIPHIHVHLLIELLLCFSKKDFSTAILEKKKAPNKLQVEDSKQDDNSIVEMTQAKMDELKIFKGDTVILRGKHLILIVL